MQLYILSKCLLYYVTAFVVDVDDCANNPCQNGGSCADLVNGYTCNCVTGYDGVNCANSMYTHMHTFVPMEKNNYMWK